MVQEAQEDFLQNHHMHTMVGSSGTPMWHPNVVLHISALHACKTVQAHPVLFQQSWTRQSVPSSLPWITLSGKSRDPKKCQSKQKHVFIALLQGHGEYIDQHASMERLFCHFCSHKKRLGPVVHRVSVVKEHFPVFASSFVHSVLGN